MLKESIKSLDILLFSCPCCEVLVSAISELYMDLVLAAVPTGQ